LKKKSPADLKKAQIAKATRALVRLKHSLAADEEINSILPDTLGEFDEAYANGELKELVAGLNDAIGGDDAPSQ
jgi:arginine/lysine/ornithine decarboxylase